MKRILFALIIGILLTYLSTILTPSHDILNTKEYSPIRTDLSEVLLDLPGIVLSGKSGKQSSSWSEMGFERQCDNKQGIRPSEEVTGYPAPVTIHSQSGETWCDSYVDITKLSIVGILVNVMLYGLITLLVIVYRSKLMKRIRPKGKKELNRIRLTKKKLLIVSAAGLILTLISLAVPPIKTTGYFDEVPAVTSILFSVTSKTPEVTLVGKHRGQEDGSSSYGGACLTAMPTTYIVIRGYPAPTVVDFKSDDGSYCGGSNVDRTVLFIGGLIINALIYSAIILLVIVIIQKLRGRTSSVQAVDNGQNSV